MNIGRIGLYIEGTRLRFLLLLHRYIHELARLKRLPKVKDSPPIQKLISLYVLFLTSKQCRK